MAKLVKQNTQGKSPNSCKFGRLCVNDKCPFYHPNGKGYCKYGNECGSSKCDRFHPEGKGNCFKGKTCYVKECDCLHPEGKNFCIYGLKCFNQNCEFNHPEGKRICKFGSDCSNKACILDHPLGKIQCNLKNCVDNYCTFYHSKVIGKIHNVRKENCKRLNCNMDHTPSVIFEEISDASPFIVIESERKSYAQVISN